MAATFYFRPMKSGAFFARHLYIDLGTVVASTETQQNEHSVPLRGLLIRWCAAKKPQQADFSPPQDPSFKVPELQRAEPLQALGWNKPKKRSSRPCPGARIKPLNAYGALSVMRSSGSVWLEHGLSNRKASNPRSLSHRKHFTTIAEPVGPWFSL